MAAFLEGLLLGGKYEKELKDLQQKAAKEPKNVRLRVRIADLLKKMGKRSEAVEAYRNASEEYARQGLLIQAIALNKIILRLDPSKAKIHDQIADLYAQWGRAGEEPMGQIEKGETRAALEPGRLPVIPLFSDLKKEELSRVMEKIEVRGYPKGKAICNEGDSGDSIFIVSHGKVIVFRRHPTQGKMVLNELKEGDFFGEFGFFSNSKRQASVETLEDTDVLEITKGDFQKIIEEFPSVSQVLFKFYKERVLENLLAASPLFQTFSPPERRQILDRLTLEEFPPGAIVLEEGAQGDCLYIVKSGEVEVYTYDPKGLKLVLATLKEGDYFGEISLLTGRPRTASVKVLKAAELLRLGKEDFDQIAEKHPETLKVVGASLQLRLESKLRMLGVFQRSPGKEGLI